MLSIFYVYLLLDPRNFYIPFYVGKGKGKRWKDHFKDHNGKNYLKKAIIRKIEEQGLEPSVMLWEQNLTEEQAFNLETQLIKKFGRRNLNEGILANLTDGGEGVKRKVFTEKERKERSIRTSGERNPMFGKTHSETVRKATSERFKGKPGHSHTKQWREYLKNNNAGGKATAKPLYQIDSNGRVVAEWPSANQAAKQLKINRGNIGTVINTHRKCGGFWWRFTNSSDVINGILINHILLQSQIDAPPIQKAILQIDPLTQQTIRKWDSYRQASDTLGLEYGALWAATKHKRIYADFFWKRIM